MTVRKLMHDGVSCVHPSTTIGEIATIMKDQDIGSVPVVEDDRLVGMVTDRDIVIRACSKGGEISKITASKVMTSGIEYCYADDSIKSAVKMMEAKRIRRLLVVDADTRMVGMLSIGDLTHGAGAKHTEDLMEAVSDHHFKPEISRAPTVGTFEDHPEVEKRV